MNPVALSKHNANYLKIDYNEDIERLLLANFYYYNSNNESIPLFKIIDDSQGKSILLRYGFYDHLIKLLLINGINIGSISNDINLKSSKIQISQKWKDILDTDYRVVNNENQYQVLSKLLEYNRACGQIYTSYGKTELLLAIAESYLDQYPDRNVVILIPGDTVKKELLGRHQKWEVKHGIEYSKFNKSIQLVNPIGLLKNKDLKNGKITPKTQKIIDYFKNTGLVLIDELHHLSAETYQTLLEIYLTDYTFIYGVSGSVDPDGGLMPTIKDNLPDLKYRLLITIGFLGLPRLDVKNPTKLLIGYLRVQGVKLPKNIQMYYNLCIKRFFNSHHLLVSIVGFLKTNPDRRMFLPIIEIEQGKSIVDKINQLYGDDVAVFVSSAGTYPNVKERGYENIKDYMIRYEKFRIIIGTSAIYESFNSDRINTILLGIGKSFRMTMQPTGRGVRSDDIPLVLLPWDLSGTNPIINKQTREKYARLKQEYVNHKFINLE
jgi:hypothetical protein